MTQYVTIDLRPAGREGLAHLSPWQVARTLLEEIEPGASEHCLRAQWPDDHRRRPTLGVYVWHHVRLDVCIVVDDRTPEERAT